MAPFRTTGKKVMCQDGVERTFHNNSPDKPYEYGYVQLRDENGTRRTVTGMVLRGIFHPHPESLHKELIPRVELAPKDKDT